MERWLKLWPKDSLQQVGNTIILDFDFAKSGLLIVIKKKVVKNLNLFSIKKSLKSTSKVSGNLLLLAIKFLKICVITLCDR